MKQKFFPIDIFKDNKFIYELLSKESRIILKDKLWNKDSTINAYIPSKDSIVIACRIPPIEHEIAHIVEMNDLSRLLKVDFDMPFIGPKADLFYMKKSAYIAGCARETRVRAIQSIIEDNDDYDSFMEQPLNNVMYNLANRFFDQSYDFETRFKDTDEFIDWLRNIRIKTMNDWNKDRVVESWNIRMEYLKSWMT